MLCTYTQKIHKHTHYICIHFYTWFNKNYLRSEIEVFYFYTTGNIGNLERLWDLEEILFLLLLTVGGSRAWVCRNACHSTDIEAKRGQGAIKHSSSSSTWFETESFAVPPTTSLYQHWDKYYKPCLDLLFFWILECSSSCLSSKSSPHRAISSPCSQCVNAEKNNFKPCKNLIWYASSFQLSRK